MLRALDRETTPSYSLRVKAEDQGTPRLSSIAEYTVTIEDSNDNSPQFSADQVTTVHVREDQAPGEVLLSLQATDADTGTIYRAGRSYISSFIVMSCQRIICCFV